MALESHIDARDGWFTGEDKLLEFTVTGELGGWDTWQFEWALYRDGVIDPVIVKSNSSGIVAQPLAVGAVAGVVTVYVAAEDTAGLDVSGATFQHVLRRVDPGNRQVLSFGGAVLRSVVAA